MSQISVEKIESMILQNPYNEELLHLLLENYETGKDQAGFLRLIDFYRSKLDCPEKIKILLFKACHYLKLDSVAIQLFPNKNDSEIFLIRAKIHFSEQELEEAKKYYLLAISRDENLSDKEFEKKLNINMSSTPLVQDKILLFKKNNTKTNHLQILQEPPAITFNDVGGLSEVKTQINRRIIAPFLKPGIFQRFKRRIGGGVLLYGPPGCGKTLIARATAGECGCHFINVMLTDILSKWIGESEHNLHQIFERAREKKPSIIFIDEIDAIAMRRQANDSISGKEGIISLLLTELDGFNQNNDGILVLAATNIPWTIDSAFRRPGRFDRQFFVPPPDAVARATIIKNLLADKPTQTNIDIDYLVKCTTGFSGADLRNLVEVAEDYAIDQMIADESEESELSDKMLKSVLKRVKPSTLEWLTIARNYIEYANPGSDFDDVKEFLKKYAKNN